ncbi:retrovirus-related pol polyprotein from transposon TNT 1-94 [Tanacetum coccineum]
MEDGKETDEHEEVDEDELKKHLVIVKDDDIAIDVLPLATKPPVIVEYKLIKEGIIAYYQLIRADGSSKRYSSMIRMLQGIDGEDLQTLWKLVKTKHGDTRPEDEHERVLWGDFKVMFEPDIKSNVWGNLQGYKICLGVDLEPDEWIKDSGCSKHMTGNRKLFSTYKAYNGGNVIFGSNLRGNIIGKGTISNDSLKIDNVEHVDNLGFNLLSIGQICDNKCRVTFSEHDSEITKDGKVIGRGIRKKGLYVMKLGNKPKDQICLTTIDENSTLWHRRLGHANMRLIQSLASKEFF